MPATATPPSLTGRDVTLLTGRVALLPGSQAESGIAKTPVTGPVHLGAEGIEGDERADRRVHGGVEKTVHHYPRDHSATWAAERGPCCRSPGPAPSARTCRPLA